VNERRISLGQNLSPGSKVPVAFATTWVEFVGAVEGITGKGTVSCTDHEKAWDHFEPVFAKTYAYELDFSNALFDALRDSLTGVCTELLPRNKESEPASFEANPNSAGGGSTMISDRSTWKREMRLGATNIGFATNFYCSPQSAFPRE
jgi:hypothetical protein